MLRFTPEPADAGALCYKQKMRNDLSIREEKSKDFPFIRSLTEQAFLNVPESDHTEHLLVERLRQSEAYIPELSLVAETNTYSGTVFGGRNKHRKNRRTHPAFKSGNRIRKRHDYRT